MRSLLQWASTALLASQAVGITVDVTSQDSIKEATSTIAYGMMKYYTGNNTGDVPGNLPDPYYWWEAGAMFMNMIEYWFCKSCLHAVARSHRNSPLTLLPRIDTGDTTYNDETIQAIVHQAGPKGGESFVPNNQSKTEGNDDQIFWAFAAMNAAELNFPAPPDDAPSWAAMAQSVFNGQASRWDENCDGGLRWQMFGWNNGYNYKNIAANGGFFLLTSKLARYTGNTTFNDWAEKQWDWFSQSVLFEQDGFQVNDGTDMAKNCTVANTQQWSYNYGFYIAGLAYMYNHVSHNFSSTHKDTHHTDPSVSDLRPKMAPTPQRSRHPRLYRILPQRRHRRRIRLRAHRQLRHQRLHLQRLHPPLARRHRPARPRSRRPNLALHRCERQGRRRPVQRRKRRDHLRHEVDTSDVGWITRRRTADERSFSCGCEYAQDRRFEAALYQRYGWRE